MAIEKIEGAPKVEWTAATLIQLGVTVVLVGLSCLFGWLAFSNWRFKANLVEGYQEYDCGRAEQSKAPLEAALSWRPDHTGARELLAKVLCDAGKLEEARKHYQRLVAQGHTVPQVQIGLGVIALKEVEASDKQKAIELLVTEAANAFRSAGSIPEAEIGLGHCDLVLGRKLGNPAYFTRAQATFGKIAGEMEKKEYRTKITRDGLVDYYAGLGKALGSSDKPDDRAVDAFRACFQYTPNWMVPLANVLSLQARRFAGSAESNEVMLKLQPDIVSLRNQAGAAWKSRSTKDRGVLLEPWMQYSLALAQAWGRAGNITEMQTIVRDLIQTPGLEQRLEPLLLDAMIRGEAALKDDPIPATQDAAVTKASAGYNDLVQRLPNDDANRERRAIAYNDSAWTLAWRGGYASNEGFYQQAVQRLTEALRLFPDDYVYNRNMAIVLKRFKKAPSAPGPYVEKCRAAAAKDRELADDFDRVQKYIEAK